MPTAPRRSGTLAAALAVTASLAGAHLVDIWLLGHATGHPLTTAATRADVLTPVAVVTGIAALGMRVLSSARGGPATSAHIVRVAVAAHLALFALEVLEQALTDRADRPVVVAIILSAVAHVVVSTVVVIGAHAAHRVGERVAQRGRCIRRPSVNRGRWSVSQLSQRRRRVAAGGGLALRAPPPLTV